MTQVKSNESDIALEADAREVRPAPREEELSELAVRILSDFARIVAAEARLLESNIVGAAEILLDRLYLASILVVLVAMGVVLLLASVALLLHHWMAWWQAAGLEGALTIILSEVLRRSLIPPSTAAASRSVTESRQS